MPLSSQKKNFIFITFAIISTIVISIFSYFYFSSLLENIESKMNTKNNKHLLQNLIRNIKNTQNLAFEYSKDNALYNFIFNKHSAYTNNYYSFDLMALNHLELSFILVTNLDNKAVYSLNSPLNSNINLSLLEKNIKNHFKEKNINSSIIKINNTFHIVSREHISTSDAKQISNGYFYLAKEIKNKEFKEFNANIFSNEHLKNIRFNEQDSKIVETKDFKKIVLTSVFLDEGIFNRMHFFDKNMNYTFSIKSKKSYTILEEGKKKILVYNLVIITSLLFIFFLIYKFQKFLNINKKQLERLVDLKTRQTKITLKKLEIAHKKLFAVANTDYLTKINNRRNFFHLSKQEFLRANECNENLSLIMIDIDNFKQINDTYGHNIGDEILKMFVNAFKPHLGKEHIFGRLGGEEFAITLPRCNLEEARIKAEILRAALQQAFTHNDTKKIGITASFGVAQMKDDTCIDDVLQTADNLLYAAKKSGKNRVRSRIMPMDKIKEQIQNL